MMGMGLQKMVLNACHVLILVSLVIRHKQIAVSRKKSLMMVKRTKPTLQTLPQVVRDM